MHAIKTYTAPKDSLLKNILTLSGATALSRVLGLVRDVLIAHLFGASRAYDAYLIAFMIPHMLRRLLAEGALSSAFVPLFTERLSRESVNGATRFANNVLTVALLFFPFFSLLGILLAPLYVPFLADGFSREEQSLAIQLAQIVFPFIGLMGIAAILMGVLNSYERFFAPSFAPVLFNLGFVLATVALVGFFAEPVYALAAGVLIGGVAQLFFQVPYLRDHWRFRPEFNLRDEQLKKLCLLMLPSIVGLAIFQINVIVDNKLASHLAEGSVSALQYAVRLFQLPLGLFAVSIANAILPQLSQHAALHEREALAQTLQRGIKLTAFIVLPATIGLGAIAEPVIRLLFEHGQFTPEDTQRTLYALLGLLPGLAGYALVYLLTRAFYALQDTRTPVFVGGAAVALNVGLDYLFVGPLGVGGLTLATSLAGIANALLLLVLLQRRLKIALLRPILPEIAKRAGAALLMGATVALLVRSLSALPELVLVSAAVLCGTALYLGLTQLGGFSRSANS
ncbi:murein biosynthesis integral membrane protein MurJ [Candidatus Acetothermia bacterium]|jgi:putative peptidoglycan lipid II flippase|nr:murein biosynthesis integral membrane protein MurJ [Candidatus Acetothermia bacterium]MCI2431996.1 murein biosynthesis integral membrane protein MurJ [Candidatus Acetothermia bacterium]MCI2436793.1 murein biosynthesis integral membrane protein MurJ [Candidatus Acetothermia bacterium]